MSIAKPIRAFIAVKIPATPSLRKVSRQLAEMGRPVKAVAADNLHVTLKFLGDTDPELIPEISGIVEAAAAADYLEVMHKNIANITPVLRTPATQPEPSQ